MAMNPLSSPVQEAPTPPVQGSPPPMQAPPGKTKEASKSAFFKLKQLMKKEEDKNDSLTSYVSFAKPNMNAYEHLGCVTITVVRTGNLNRKTVVKYAPVEEAVTRSSVKRESASIKVQLQDNVRTFKTAQESTHYSAAHGSITFMKGETEKVISVGIFDRERAGPSTAFELALALELFHPHVQLGPNPNVRVKILVDRGIDYFGIILHNQCFQCPCRAPVTLQVSGARHGHVTSVTNWRELNSQVTRRLNKVFMVNSTVSVKNWRENWLDKVFTVNATVSVKNWRENWLDKVFTVNATVSVVVMLCTAFALFGNDLAVVYGDKSSDKIITIVTAFNIGIFSLELVLMLGSKGTCKQPTV
eukprot:1195390-Prorocentrum_minimum.AAC.6